MPKVFFYDKDRKAVAGDISDIKTDKTGDRYGGVYYTVNNDGEVDFVMLYTR